MPREPFTRDQLVFIEARSLHALRVWGRALKHLNRIGDGGHELARVIRAAHDAEHSLRVHAMYAKHEAEKRDNVRPSSGRGGARATLHRRSAGVAHPAGASVVG